MVKDLEAKLGPLKVKTNTQCDEEAKSLVDEKEKADTHAKQVKSEDKSVVDKNEEKTDMPVKHVRFGEATAAANSHSEGSDHGKGELVESSTSDHKESSLKKRELVESSADRSTNEEEVAALIPVPRREEGLSSPAKLDEQMEKKSLNEEVVSPIKEEHSEPTIQLTEPIKEDKKHADPTANNEVLTESPPKEMSTMAKSEEEFLGTTAPVKKETEPLTQQS